ncbi:MAG TPA: O-antigen ligase family protein [Gemmatimonadaceae bacterium]|nr:O-antigen ligase family protein [Gemmatimonadaceae bacterium]
MNRPIALSVGGAARPVRSLRETLADALRAIPRPTPAQALALLSFLGLVLVVLQYGTPTALGAVALVAAVIPLLLWPEAATLLMVFLLYANIPAVASQHHGVPRFLAGAFVLLLIIPLGRIALVRREALKADRTFGGMLLFLGVLLIASLRARGLGLAMDRILTFAVEGLLLYWLVINVVRTLSTLRRVIWAILIAGAMLGGLTTYQEMTGSFDQQFGGLAQRNYEYLALKGGLLAEPDDPDVRAQVEEVLQRTGGERTQRAEGPVDEPNRFAQILLVLLPLAAFAYRTGRSRGSRIAAATLGLLIASGIAFSDSRGALIALVVVIAAAVKMRWVRPAHLLVGCILMIPIVPVVAPRLPERIVSIAAAASLVGADRPGAADGAIRGRATEMLAAFQAFLDHPVIGVGPGQYRPFYSEEYHQRNPRLAFRDIKGTRRAHTLYLELAAELGVVGLVAFLSIVLLLMRELGVMRRRWAGHPQLADLAAALQLTLLAYLATGVFLHLAYERYYWFLLALAGAGVEIARRLEWSPAHGEGAP